jgi:hypothetical protein
MTPPRAWMLAVALALPAGAFAFQADLVPASGRPEAADITGSVSIGGADGTVRVSIENVNDAAGDSLDSSALVVQLRLRVNGQKRRVLVPLTVDSGDGEAETSLGLVPDDKVVVLDVRVRGLGHRTIAQAGVITSAPASSPPTTLPPPPPDQCPAALQACQDDLASCQEDLDDCESGL